MSGLEPWLFSTKALFNLLNVPALPTLSNPHEEAV